MYLGRVDAEQVNDAVEVLDRGELDGQLALSLTEVDPHPGVESVREPRGQVVQLRVAGSGTRFAGSGSVVTTERDDLLDVAYRQPLGHDPLCQALHGGTVGKSEQRSRVTGAQNTGGDPTLHQRGELEQAQGVGDLRARAAYPGGELVVGAAEVVQQLLVGRRLFQRVELTAVQVLQQGVTQQVVVVGVLDDGRDEGASPAACAARQRRSPMISSNCGRCAPSGVSPTPEASSSSAGMGRTTTGCNTPISRIEFTSSAMSSSSKACRGCLGFGRIERHSEGLFVARPLGPERRVRS